MLNQFYSDPGSVPTYLQDKKSTYARDFRGVLNAAINATPIFASGSDAVIGYNYNKCVNAELVGDEGGKAIDTFSNEMASKFLELTASDSYNAQFNSSGNVESGFDAFMQEARDLGLSERMAVQVLFDLSDSEFGDLVHGKQTADELSEAEISFQNNMYIIGGMDFNEGKDYNIKDTNPTSPDSLTQDENARFKQYFAETLQEYKNNHSSYFGGEIDQALKKINEKQ